MSAIQKSSKTGKHRVHASIDGQRPVCGGGHQARTARWQETLLEPDCKRCRSIISSQQKQQTQTNKTKMNLNELSKLVHAANIKWWQDVNTGQRINRNKGELLALIHSEISEALEGERKNLMDDKLPHRKMAEVELVDAIIRILDYAGGFGYDLQGAFDEKMAFNANRQDHKHETRREAGGKQF